MASSPELGRDMASGSRARGLGALPDRQFHMVTPFKSSRSLRMKPKPKAPAVAVPDPLQQSEPTDLRYLDYDRIQAMPDGRYCIGDPDHPELILEPAHTPERAPHTIDIHERTPHAH